MNLVERAEALKLVSSARSTIHRGNGKKSYQLGWVENDVYHEILAALQPPALDCTVCKDDPIECGALPSLRHCPSAALDAERLERPYGPFYYIENTAKLLRDIDKNGGLQEGGEQYPNGLCCLDNAQRLENGLKEIRLALSAPTWRDISDTPESIDGYSSIRVLGILENGTHVFAQYTPHYLGRADEHQMLWICEGFGWAQKPKYWRPLQPLPPAPSSEGGT